MQLFKSLTVFTFGGLAYGLVEIMWRGSTHISMFVAGGLCFLIITAIDSAEAFGGGVLLEAPLCAISITAVELVCGVVVNLMMHLQVWDYSELPLNLWGQICLPFSVLWLMLAVPAILASRLLKHLVFCEELPRLGLLPRWKRETIEEA